MASRATAPSKGRRGVNHRAILESAGAIIYAHDLQGHFIYLNAHAAEALGYDAAETKRFLGMSFFDLLAPGAMAAAAVMMRRGAKRPLDVHTFRLDVRRKDGTAVTLEIRARPLWQGGVVVGRVGVARIVDQQREPIDADVIERAVVEERSRIAHALRDRITDVVLGLATDQASAASRATDGDASSAGDVLRRHGLDDTDLAIVRLVIKGASNPEIGRQVHLSAAAVKDRIGRLMRRLGAHRRAELSAQALRAGIM
jgi:PAS domain S-box-containing protein